MFATARAGSGTQRTITVDGIELTFWLYGAPRGQPLVMLHGLGSDHTGLLDVAARLPGMRLIVPDLPGFGHSPPLPVGHTLHRYASVLDGLRRRLGLSRFALLGHSLGADIALTYASTYRAAVSALCLLNPVLKAHGRAARFAQFYYDVCAGLPAALSRPLLISRAAVYLSDRAMFTTRDPLIRRRILRRDYATARLADPHAIQDSFLSIRDAPFDRYAQRLRVRTLLVTGTRDVLSTPASLAALHWHRPYPELKVLGGAGHLLPIEQPDRIADLVRRFLREPVAPKPPAALTNCCSP